MRFSDVMRSLNLPNPLCQSHRRKNRQKDFTIQSLEERRLLVADIALVADVNTVGESAGSEPQELTQVGSTLFFTAADKTHGRELWKKEGTNPAVLVRDIFPGTEGSRITEMTAVGNTLFFIADDGANGPELWKSNGTTAGTLIVKNWTKNPADTNPLTETHPGYGTGGDNLTNVNGKLFYRSGTIDRPGQGWVSPFLMVSDGTGAGTRIVTTDVSLPLPWNSGGGITAVGNEAWFYGFGLGNEGAELWKSDGTAAGTVLVADVWPGTSASGVRDITPVGSTVYFVAWNSVGGFNLDTELWKSDGTSAGTSLVKDIRPGDNSSFPQNLFNFNGTLMFTAEDGTSGRELWKSDGTSAGTVQVKDIHGGIASSNPGNMTQIGNTLYFSASDSVNGQELWKTDGTTAGTVMVGHGGTSSNFNPSRLVNIGGSLYFRAFTFETGYEVFRSDGTTAGTNVFKDLRPGTSSSSPTQLTNVNGVLHYAANDGMTGNELWQHNVTTNTTTISDIFRGTVNSNARDFTNVNGTIFFVADDGVNGEELWKTNADGTNTSLVKDINVGTSGSLIRELTNVNGTLYFVAWDGWDGTTGEELWKSDGTAAGTVMVKNIANSGSSTPRGLVNFNGTLLFSAAQNGVDDRELWKSDGTEAGTVLVKDIQSGAAAGIDRFFPEIVPSGSVAYFSANDGANGFELWKTDGTTAGTVLVKDIRTATSSSDPGDLFNFNGTLYFTAWDGVNGRELWKSDGTASGTSMVADLTPGATGSSFRNFTNANGRLIFQSYNSGSNGVFTLHSIASPGSSIVTINQTQNSGHARVFDQPLTAVGDTVFFAHQDNDTGMELWKSDGTSAGTVPVRDINTRVQRIGNLSYPPSGSNPVNLVNNNGTLYFTADNGINGQELWKSDGTSAGTKLVADITGDAGSSHPENLTVVNSRIYMTAVTESTGREVFAVLDQPEGTNGNDVFVLTYGNTDSSGTVSLTVSSDGGPTRHLGTFPMAIPLRIDGLGGTDTITVRGTAGNDIITADYSGIRVNGSLLTLASIESRILNGGAGNDTYRFDADGQRGSFTLDESLGGIDTIDFSATTLLNVALNLSTSGSQIVNTNLAVSLLSGSTFENVTGGGRDDILVGNSQSNVLIGGPGSDQLRGSAGDDLYIFGPVNSTESDVVTEYAGQGTDTLSFSTLTSGVTLSLGTATVQTVHTGRNLRLSSSSNFENAVGGSGHDRLTGNVLANRLIGNSGHDTLAGAAGSDILAGGLGNDSYVFGSSGAAESDQVVEVAGQGIDTLSFSTLSTAVTINLASTQIQTVNTNRTLKLNSPTAFENIIGGRGSDVLFGNSVSNLLRGESGHDILVGSSGNDVLIGGTGRDLLIGGLGADTLDGGADDDILIAGRTSHDVSASNLQQLRDVWISSATYSNRVATLRSGTGSPLVTLRAKVSVRNDTGEDDTLTGGSGADWFLKATDDIITDLLSSEITDVL